MQFYEFDRQIVMLAEARAGADAVAGSQLLGVKVALRRSGESIFHGNADASGSRFDSEIVIRREDPIHTPENRKPASFNASKNGNGCPGLGF